MPPPGKNVWKYLVELDRRRTTYKTKGTIGSQIGTCVVKSYLG